MTDDALGSRLSRRSALIPRDRPDARIYFLRVRVGDTVYRLGVEVEDSHVDSPRVRALAEAQGLDRESTYLAVAIDSVRVQMEAAGLTPEQQREAEVLTVRRTTSAELLRMIAEEGS